MKTLTMTMAERHYGVSGTLLRQMEAFELALRPTRETLERTLSEAIALQAASPGCVVEIAPDGVVSAAPAYKFVAAGRRIYKPSVGNVEPAPPNPTLEDQAFHRRLAKRRAANKAAKQARRRNRK